MERGAQPAEAAAIAAADACADLMAELESHGQDSSYIKDEDGRRIVDAVLSTVLGKTRVASVILRAGENVSEIEGTVTTLSHDAAVLEDER